jgi:hypothetical protein
MKSVVLERPVKFPFLSSGATADPFKSYLGGPPRNTGGGRVSKAIQVTPAPIRPGHIGVIACGGEHREGLDVNIGDFLFPGKGMSPDSVQKGMDNQIGITACFLGLAQDIRSKLSRMVYQLTQQPDEILPSIIQASA